MVVFTLDMAVVVVLMVMTLWVLVLHNDGVYVRYGSSGGGDHEDAVGPGSS